MARRRPSSTRASDAIGRHPVLLEPEICLGRSGQVCHRPGRLAGQPLEGSQDAALYGAIDEAHVGHDHRRRHVDESPLSLGRPAADGRGHPQRIGAAEVGPMRVGPSRYDRFEFVVHLVDVSDVDA